MTLFDLPTDEVRTNSDRDLGKNDPKSAKLVDVFCKGFSFKAQSDKMAFCLVHGLVITKEQLCLWARRR